jgi:hypothetical protein
MSEWEQSGERAVVTALDILDDQDAQMRRTAGR